MNKYKKYIIQSLFIMLIITVMTSCGKSSKSILGKWQYENGGGLEFFEEGVVVMYSVRGWTNWETTAEKNGDSTNLVVSATEYSTDLKTTKGSYAINDDSILFDWDGATRTCSYTIKGNTLTLSYDGNTTTYTRTDSITGEGKNSNPQDSQIEVESQTENDTQNNAQDSIQADVQDNMQNNIQDNPPADSQDSIPTNDTKETDNTANPLLCVQVDGKSYNLLKPVNELCTEFIDNGVYVIDPMFYNIYDSNGNKLDDRLNIPDPTYVCLTKPHDETKSTKLQYICWYFGKQSKFLTFDGMSMDNDGNLLGMDDTYFTTLLYGSTRPLDLDHFYYAAIFVDDKYINRSYYSNECKKIMSRDDWYDYIISLYQEMCDAGVGIITPLSWNEYPSMDNPEYSYEIYKWALDVYIMYDCYTKCCNGEIKCFGTISTYDGRLGFDITKIAY